MELLLIFIGLVLFNLAARRWGVSSGDGLDSPEWQARRTWRAYRRG